MEPKTNFPDPPKNRWDGWQGILFRGDENFIFTESVCHFLYFRSRYVTEFRDDPDLSESIFDLFRKIQKICESPLEKEREIRKSIKSRLLILLHFYVRRRVQKRNEKRKKDVVIEEKLVQNDYPVIGESEMTLFWKEEFQKVFYQALLKLSDLQREIIEKVLQGSSISGISRELQKPRTLIEKEFKKASEFIDTFCSEKGLDIYRS
jgi:hypothetical protein